MVQPLSKLVPSDRDYPCKLVGVGRYDHERDHGIAPTGTITQKWFMLSQRTVTIGPWWKCEVRLSLKVRLSTSENDFRLMAGILQDTPLFDQFWKCR